MQMKVGHHEEGLSELDWKIVCGSKLRKEELWQIHSPGQCTTTVFLMPHCQHPCM